MTNFFEKIVQVIKKEAKNVYWLAPFIILSIWIIDTIVSLVTTRFPEVESIYFVALLLAKAGVLVYLIYIWINLFINQNTKKNTYKTFVTFTGYAVIFIYVFYNLPRMAMNIAHPLAEAKNFSLWLPVFISSLWPFLLYFFMRFHKTQIRWGIITEDMWKNRKKVNTEEKQKMTVTDHIVENVHVIVQAIISVIIIQHFFFQMYQIPTESMVPTFLARERVFVNKMTYGPTIPLTNWHIPSLSKLEREDIVVFESPSYEQPNIMKKIFHQFVFYLTLSMVDIDKDEDGNPKKQLIVKRLVGLPGEKVKMIDDVVYVKNKGEKEFRVLEGDAKYARTDLHEEPEEIKQKIQFTPINGTYRKMFNKWDDWKRNVSVEKLNASLEEEAAQFTENYGKIDPEAALKEYKKMLDITFRNYETELETIKAFRKKQGVGVFTDIASLRGTIPLSRRDPTKGNNYQQTPYYYDHIIFYEILENQHLAEEFPQFLLSTVKKGDDGELDDYGLNSRKFNLYFKLLLAKQFNRYLMLFINNVSVNDAKMDIGRLSSPELINEYNELLIYIMFYDFRNFPEYPSGEGHYIPEGKYFLLGDNRYNSHDFRYRNLKVYMQTLDDSDPYSVQYLSNLGPYLLERNNILGTGIFRVWPPGRMAVLH